MESTEPTVPPTAASNAAILPTAPVPAAPGAADQPVTHSPPLVPAPAALQTIDLTKRYGSLTALEALNLELERGDVFGFIGPNGAGKSTTMKIVAGLLQPTSGSARVLGRDVATNGQFVRQNIGYMPDFIGVYEDLKVCEYLEFFASAYGIPRKQRKKVVNDVLELTDLRYKQDAMVDSLSRGMTQRLSLARVLVHDPPVLLLDEPASGLDPRARIEIRELLKELQRLGKTILVSSHILSELGEFCNKLGIIERGKLLVVGTIDELIARARANLVIALQVVGESEPAAGLLRSDSRVERVDHDNGTLMITLADAATHHHFMIEILLARGIRIQSIMPHQLKLEDVFLRLTKGLVQ